MNSETAILCVNGSDSTGYSGIQADIKTVKDLGAYAVTAITSVTVQNSEGISDSYEMPSALVAGQIKAIYNDVHPKAVKIGMTGNAANIRAIRDEIVGCSKIVCSPGVLASNGGCMMSNDALYELCVRLIPICTLLMLKCTDAEIILGRRINTDNDMVDAARSLIEKGAEWVLLRGGTYNEGRINALLYHASGGEEEHRAFFSSINVEGWQKHGVGGTLSTAIATRLAMGDDVPTAVKNAHNYLHSKVIYSVPKSMLNLRPNDLCNTFLTLVSAHYAERHDVAYYADQMSITPRYLSQVTKTVSGQSPKQIIDAHIASEAQRLLTTTTLSVQEIAIKLGFSSQIIFARFFRRMKNNSATSYRQKV